MAYTNANTPFPNEVLENKFKDLLETALDARTLMDIDGSLQGHAGMIKKVNTYEYEGAVEQLAMGAGNTVKGSVTYTTDPREVLLYQQAFEYADEQIMEDPAILDFGLKGMAQTMVQEINDQYFAELAKTTSKVEADVLSYDAVVDAIALMNVEDENGIFLLIGNDNKAVLRKDPDFKAVEGGKIIINGQIGWVGGLPVIVSKMVPEGEAYVATRKAVKFLTKKEVEAEQDRDADTRVNNIYMRRVGLIYLADATQAVKIVPAVVAP